MLIATISDVPVWLLGIIVLVLIPLTYAITRANCDKVDYHSPIGSWIITGRFDWWRYRVVDHHQEGPTLAQFRPKELARDLWCLNAWNFLLVGDFSNYVAVCANGAVLGDMPAIERWAEERQHPSSAVLPIVKIANSVPHTFLNGIKNSHHYDELLVLEENGYILGLYRLAYSDPSPRPWLLVFQDAGHGEASRHIETGDITLLLEAHRMATHAIMHHASLNAGAWKIEE